MILLFTDRFKELPVSIKTRIRIAKTQKSLYELTRSRLNELEKRLGCRRSAAIPDDARYAKLLEAALADPETTALFAELVRSGIEIEVMSCVMSEEPVVMDRRGRIVVSDAATPEQIKQYFRE